MTERKQTAKTEGYFPISMFSEGLLIGKRPFQDGAMFRKTALFRAIAQKFQRPTIPQLNIESLTASKTNILHYLALQSEVLAIPYDDFLKRPEFTSLLIQAICN